MSAAAQRTSRTEFPRRHAPLCRALVVSSLEESSPDRSLQRLRSTNSPSSSGNRSRAPQRPQRHVRFGGPKSNGLSKRPKSSKDVGRQNGPIFEIEPPARVSSSECGITQHARQVNSRAMSEQPNQDRVAALLKDALDGDLVHIDELRRASQEQLQLAGQALGGELTFGRMTVLRVLRDWRDGKLQTNKFIGGLCSCSLAPFRKSGRPMDGGLTFRPNPSTSTTPMMRTSTKSSSN